MAQIAVIGAGVAGLAAGRELARAGHGVTIFEKSRGVGGRVATRRAEGCAIDHGANYFKAPTPELQALVAAIPGAVNIRLPVWTFDGEGRVAAGDPAQNDEAKWTWPGGLNALAKHLAAGLDLRRETTIVRIEAAGDRQATPALIDSAGSAFGPYDAVLLTPPAAQSAAIVGASAIDAGAKAELLSALAPVRYRRCISVALAYPRRPGLPWYALINSDRRHPIAWLACEHVKPGRAPEGVGLLLAQMGPAWSERHWDALPKGTYGGGLPDAVLAVHMLLRPLTGADLGPPLWADAQRWRYALPEGAAGPAPGAARAGLYLAGDMLAGQGRAHLAIESGWAVAGRIHAALSASQ
jgi:renalase